MGANFSDAIVKIRPGQTVEQAFRELHDNLGFESGYQYSGTLSMKGSAWVIGKSDIATPEQFKVVYDLIGQSVEDENELLTARPEARCKSCWGEGKRYINIGATTDDGQKVTVSVHRDCADCEGKGKRILNDEELAAEKQRIVDILEALRVFGISRQILTRARATADDKWESQAIGIVYKDQAWFGATCPS
jgi:Zn finger protein HypA/HybF involved in hydrogenase expression